MIHVFQPEYLFFHGGQESWIFSNQKVSRPQNFPRVSYNLQKSRKFVRTRIPFRYLIFWSGPMGITTQRSGPFVTNKYSARVDMVLVSEFQCLGWGRTSVLLRIAWHSQGNKNIADELKQYGNYKVIPVSSLVSLAFPFVDSKVTLAIRPLSTIRVSRMPHLVSVCLVFWELFVRKTIIFLRFDVHLQCQWVLSISKH